MNAIRHTESEKKKAFKVLAEINLESKKIYNQLQKNQIPLTEFIEKAALNQNFRIFAL